ncbi:MAG: Tfp pilus assembly protein FimT [Pirellulaceae bacterium]|jgi:Tfp pilus assembly protein FimT
MEILLVLALLVVIAAVAMPVLSGPMHNQALRKSAQLVRAEWANARVEAMRSGRIYVFRYQPATGSYVVQPWFANDDYLNSNVRTVQGVAVDAPIKNNNPTESNLPDGIEFYSSLVEFATRASEVEQSMVVEGMTRPILFYPDGTTSDATVMLKNQTPFFVKVQLRGMTGISTVGELIAEDSLGASITN